MSSAFRPPSSSPRAPRGDESRPLRRCTGPGPVDRDPARPWPRRSPQGEGGFTIVEVLMASAILIVGFLGMIQGITIGSEMMATARRQTIAAQILDHEIGKLRLKDWTYLNSLSSSASATYDSDLAAIDTAIAASGVTFTLSSTVTTITTDLREVAFTVTWTKSGTNTAAATATGSWLDRLAFSGPSPIARTYTRMSTAYFGKYGINIKL